MYNPTTTFLVGTSEDIKIFKKMKNIKNVNSLFGESGHRLIEYKNIRELKKLAKLYDENIGDWSTNFLRGISVSHNDTVVLINLSKIEENYIKKYISILLARLDNNFKMPRIEHMSVVK